MNVSTVEGSEAVNALMRSACEAMPNGVVIVNDIGAILFVNARIERDFGYARAELIGQPVETLLPERFRAAHGGQRAQFLAEGGARLMGAGRDLLARRKNGAEFPVEIGLNPVATDGGIVVVASIVDISARIAEDYARRESETRLRDVLEHVVDGVVSIDERGVMQSANPATERLFGYSAAEMIGRNVSMLMPEPYHSAHDSYIANYLRTGETKIIGIGREVVGRRKDGSTLPLDLGVSEFRVGETRYFTGILRDITERKKIEEQLHFYASELETRNEDLIRSNKELDDFAYIASHDLKEPLRGIHNYSSFLIEDYAEKLDDEGRDKLQTIARLAQRLECLIDTLLIYSRVGRIDLAVQETDLHAVVADVIESLSISLHEKGIDVRTPERLPKLDCDSARIAEVFRNLIANAIKYNDKPEKWIEIGVRPAQGRVPQTFYVRDNGIGIHEKHLDSVFRIFKRLHGREQYGGGTGAGLTIVKKIVERHGGRVWIESIYGEGSASCFTLEAEN